MVMMTNPSFSQKVTSSNDWTTLETGKKSPIPESWIDNKTGNRIVKLTDKRGDNRSFYFHNNPFIPAKSGSGDLMVFYGSTDNGHQLFTVNLSTKETIRITNHTNPIFGEIVDAKRRKVYFQSLDSVYSVSIDNQKTQLEFVFPENFKASITTLNADGTKLAGVYSGKEKRELLRKYPQKVSSLKGYSKPNSHIPYLPLPWKPINWIKYTRKIPGWVMCSFPQKTPIF